MEEGLNEVDKRLNTMEVSQTSLAKQNEALREKVMYLENYTRRQNIRILGIPENAEGPRPTEFIAKLLIDVFGEDNFERPLSIESTGAWSLNQQMATTDHSPLWSNSTTFKPKS
uniref:Uncharacterized protein n=1 Tax=Nothobranchius furzeri TaxID=105023 RepID=A0A1A8UW67_NOTFU